MFEHPVLPPEKLRILSQRRGSGREDCRTAEADSREIGKLRAVGARHLLSSLMGSWTDAEDKVTALQSSSELPKRFPNECPVPANVGTETWVQTVDWEQMHHPWEPRLRKPFRFHLCALCVLIFLPEHLNCLV